MYICLCGFPPFSDELYTRENPYTLAQQIKMGRFDYPSPYWDSVGDPALDLIDRMLTVDVNKRISIDECLEHPWVTQREFTSLQDSTDGLTGAMGQLDFSKRKVQRERTLLSSINDIKVSQIVEVEGAKLNGAPKVVDAPVHVKVWEKNPEGKNIKMSPAAKWKAKNDSADGDEGGVSVGKGKEKENAHAQEEDPAANRAPEEFMAMGGKGDQRLFNDDSSSRYLPEEVPKPNTNGPLV